jgi:hypothetical protein
MMVAGSTILLHGHSIINPWGVVGGWSCLLLGAGAVRWALGVGGWTDGGRIHHQRPPKKIDHDHEDEISNTNW